MDVIDDGQGNIIVTDGGVQKLVTSVEAIASWGELLGIGDSTLVVQAMMQAKDPGIVDAATARNAWTSAFEQCERDLLEDHNQTRRLALKRAYTATGALSPDGRAETRRLLGLDDFDVATTAEDDAGDPLAPVREALSAPDVTDRLARARDRFTNGIAVYTLPFRRP